jgi:hypothetical protein
LSPTPILSRPNHSFPFYIFIDSANITIGEVIGQKEEQNPYVIYFVRKTITPTQLNYIVTKKEYIMVTYDINKYWHYIIIYPTFVHTNISSIHYLMNK